MSIKNRAKVIEKVYELSIVMALVLYIIFFAAATVSLCSGCGGEWEGHAAPHETKPKVTFVVFSLALRQQPAII